MRSIGYVCVSVMWDNVHELCVLEDIHSLNLHHTPSSVPHSIERVLHTPVGGGRISDCVMCSVAISHFQQVKLK